MRHTKIHSSKLTEDLKRNIQSIGMEAFVKYYEYFKNDCSVRQMQKIMTEEWTVKSKASRTSHAKWIFSNNLQVEALEMILKSKKDDNIKNQARQLLESERIY